MTRPPGDVGWRLLPPPGDDPVALDALAAVRRFRGTLLFDGGRRPSYDGPDGPDDADPLDLVSHHVVGYAGGVPVAALRLLPLEPGTAGACERLLGPGTTTALLHRCGLDPSEVGEGSGWVVRPGPGRARIAATTLAACLAAAQRLGRSALIGAVGTRYGQLHRVLATGFRPVPDTAPVPVPDLADELQVVFGSAATMPPGFRSLVARIAAEHPDLSTGVRS